MPRGGPSRERTADDARAAPQGARSGPRRVRPARPPAPAEGTDPAPGCDRRRAHGLGGGHLGLRAGRVVLPGGPAAPTIDRSTVDRLEVAWTAVVGSATIPVIAGDLAFGGASRGTSTHLTSTPAGSCSSHGSAARSRSGGRLGRPRVRAHDRGRAGRVRVVLRRRRCDVSPTWTARTGGSAPRSSPAIVLVSTGKRLLAFDAACGTGTCANRPGRGSPGRWMGTRPARPRPSSPTARSGP